MENDVRGAAVKVPPPLVFLFFIFAAYGLHYLRPLGIGGSPAITYIGAAMVVVGLCVILIAGYSFRRARTHIEPWKPTSKIVSTGIFSYSRNPIYVAMCIITVGAGLFLNSMIVALSAIPAIVIVYFMVVKKEEAYLEAKFGEEYLEYKRLVRRWI